MRDLLLRMYFLLRQLPADRPLSAAVAVALALLEPDDFLALHGTLLPGNPLPEDISANLSDVSGDLAMATGAAVALHIKGQGSVAVVPLANRELTAIDNRSLLNLTLERQLPLIMLVPCRAEEAEEWEARDEESYLECIQADGQDVMRLMPALRLAIDKAREGDGPTMIECVYCAAEDSNESSAVQRLSEVLITEGYATPEELI